jgi:hypothetical protein
MGRSIFIKKEEENAESNHATLMPRATLHTSLFFFLLPSRTTVHVSPIFPLTTSAPII